jgi:hypothetical protein
MPTPTDPSYAGLQVYYGDLHNHCNLSYGHGTLDDALSNARLQLDFASVTIHAAWPDLPQDDARLSYLIDYHEKGFVKAQDNWHDYLRTIHQANSPGQFVTFPSFEWHSIEYGDHCIYYKDAIDNPIIDAPDLPTLRKTLNTLETPTLLIPHHIGYKQGSRGINWRAFTEEYSPVVEIFSFHGLSERSEGAYPYLHSMGPRHEHSTAHYGWAQGNIFGVIGSTDHHNATPGSYGYGRLGVWATSLTRDAIWDAIQQRCTYALTGDRIALQFALNGEPMGRITPSADQRELAVSVIGGDAIDYIDVLHNNQLIHRETVFPAQSEDGRFKLFIEVGWGEQDTPFDWDVQLELEEGHLIEAHPRFRGHSPTASPPDDATFAYYHLEQSGDNCVRFRTHTHPNLSLHTPATEGIAVELAGDTATCLRLTINETVYTYSLAELLTGSRTIYTDGFVSPVVCLHRAVPADEFTHAFTLVHKQISTRRDWYTVRVRQHNNHWAWSSPIWVDGAAP